MNRHQIAGLRFPPDLDKASISIGYTVTLPSKNVLFSSILTIRPFTANKYRLFNVCCIDCVPYKLLSLHAVFTVDYF